ncbi:MAG: hypothetical protein MJZ81_06655 [Bacteroidales bacterium]|nr:hypothetical protein [Bacteroidales bacterium]
MIDIEFRDGMHLSTEVMNYIQEAYKEAVLGLSAGGNRVLKMPGDGVDGWAIFNGELIRIESGYDYSNGVEINERTVTTETKDGQQYEGVRIKKGYPAKENADFYIDPNSYHDDRLLLMQATLGGVVGGYVSGTVEVIGDYTLVHSGAPFSTHIPNESADPDEFKWFVNGAYIITQFVVGKQSDAPDFVSGNVIARLRGWVGAQAVLKGRAIFQQQSGEAWKDILLSVNRGGEIIISGNGLISEDSYMGASLIAVYDTAMILR